jgi:site-specific DNA recombinase
MVTAELKKNRYTYYRCTGYRGKCDLPCFREEKLGEQLGQILKDIHIPDDILQQLEQALLNDEGRAEACIKTDRDRLESKLLQIRRRIDQAYLDKLDGKISEAFWEAKSAEWNEDQQRILATLQTLKLHSQGGVQNGMRILELANKAYFLYLRQPAAEKAKLLRIVLSNCKVDAVSVYPTYRKPFDLIFNRVKTKEWLPGLDSN